MATTDTERCVRLTLLTVEGGTLISMDILLREVSRNPGSPSLCTLLHNHKDEIKQRHRRGDISRNQFYILKQTMLDEALLKEWDVPLLVKMILLLFDSTISGREQSDLKSILTIRNSICHKSHPKIDERKFVADWTKLTTCLNSLSYGLEAATRQRISQLIEDLSCGPLDLQSSISKLEQLCKNDEHMITVLAELSTVKQGQQQICDKLDGLIAEMKQLKETIGQDQWKVDIPILKSEVRIICQRQDKAKLLEDILMKVIGAAVNDQNVDQTDENAVSSAVRKFLEDLVSMDAKAVSAEKGSILLFICCRNLQGLYNLLTMCRNSTRLAGIEKALKEFTQVDARVEFVLAEDSVALITELIDEQMHHWDLRNNSGDTSHSSTLTLGIQCHSLESVSQVADYFQNGRAAERLYQLSDALSACVSDTVRVDATLKTDEFSSALSENFRMATRRKLSHSVLHASDEVIERPCSVCLKENKTVESIKFCVDCDSNLCKSCTELHKKFPAMSGHQIVDASMVTGAGGQRARPLPTEQCEDHHGKLLDTYCPTHGQLCCASYVNLHHRQCKDLQYIPDVSQGAKKSKEYKSVTKSVDNVIKQMKMAKADCLDVLQKLDVEETSRQKSLQSLRKRLIQRIDDLTKAESDKIKSRYKEVRDALQGDIKVVEDQLDATETCRKKLNEFQGDNESQLFVYIKQGEKNEKEGRSLTDTLKFSNHTRIPKYIINNSIEKYLCDVKSLGEFCEAVKLTFESEHNVKPAGKSNECWITGLCVLPDGSVILADYNNSCLKQLDHSYRVTRSPDMSSRPWDVCYTNSNNEVAVTLCERKVQFVRVGAAMEKTRSFRVDGACRGICCSQGELFVCYGDFFKDHQVCVFNLSGQVVRTIHYDQAGEPLFSDIRHITVSSNGSKLHVTDGDKGVITVDRTGNLLSTYTEPGLDAGGICTLDDDDLLVTDEKNNTVLHVSSDGKKLGVVLGKQDGTVEPQAVCYDKVNNKVIVSTYKSDTIKIYNVQGLVMPY